MKRKRFIKLLMWAGFDRNQANLAAKIIRTAGKRKGLTYFTGAGLFLNAYAMKLHGQDPDCLFCSVGGARHE